METTSDQELYAVLGASPDADAGTLRAAYLAKIREHPPERDAEAFERIRDAYQTLSDPARKMRSVFDHSAIRLPVRDLISTGGGQDGRPFLGLKPWLEALGHWQRLANGGRGNRP